MHKHERLHETQSHIAKVVTTLEIIATLAKTTAFRHLCSEIPCGANSVTPIHNVQMYQGPAEHIVFQKHISSLVFDEKGLWGTLVSGREEMRIMDGSTEFREVRTWVKAAEAENICFVQQKGTGTSQLGRSWAMGAV